MLWIVLALGLVVTLGWGWFTRRAAANVQEREAHPVDGACACLVRAALAGDRERARALLAAGHDVDRTDADGLSPLGAALGADHDAMVEMLLEAGADPNAAAEAQMPPLMAAAARGRHAAARRLLHAGAEVTFTHPAMGSALAIAATRGDLAVVETLLAAGAPIDGASAAGATPLHFAAFSGMRDVVERLLFAGADIDAKTAVGGTALRGAADGGHLAIVEQLLAEGAAPAPLDAFGKRPIDYARENGHDDIVLVLLGRDAGSDAAVPAYRPRLEGHLPPRNDATLAGAIAARAQGYRSLSSGASSLEAPSCVAAVRAIANDASLTISFPTPSTPDPRIALREVALRVWTYEGDGGELTNEARPALAAPSDEVATSIARLATYPYHLPLWSRVAKDIAADVAATEAWDLFAVMAQPPAAPPQVEPHDWILRVQVAAALTASHLVQDDAPDLGRRLVEDLLDGPVDWTSTAAVIALYDIARREPERAPQVTCALLRAARREQEAATFQHLITPAAHALLEIDPRTRREVEGILGG